LEAQVARLKAVKDAAAHVHLNARTDLFLRNADHAPHMEEAIARSLAYADIGADSFFAPGLSDLDLIAQLCAACPLPVNVMRMDDSVSVSDLAEAGVARISAGPAPFRRAMAGLAAETL
jgi:2-methylisocitrate lyase-like PEP mutase family enzyme